MKLCNLFLVLSLLAASNLFGANASSISFVYPAGGQVGSSFILEVGGLEIAGTTAPLFSHEGITGKLLSVDKLPKDRQDTAKKRDEPGELLVAKFEVNVADDVPVGLYQVRVVGDKEISNAMIFQVSDIPETNEVGNVSVDVPQELGELPILVNGKIYEGDIDAYTFKGVKGQKLLIQIDARSLKPYLADAVPGWFQAVVSLYDSSNKKILTIDDYKSQPDPVMLFEVPKTDKYTIKVNDSIYRGRDDFVYRLRVGELPFITSVYPLGINKDSNSFVNIQGINLEETKVKPDKRSRTVAVLSGGHKSNVMPIEVANVVEIVETKDYTTNAVNARTIVNGKINFANDVDVFEVNMESNKWYNFDINARTLGSPIDSKLVLYDAKGRVLASNDDYEDLYCGMAIHFADAYINYRSPKNQKGFIAVSETQSKGGDEYTYRLLISVSPPPFDVRILPDVNTAQPGGNLPITAKVFRRNGFKDEIKLTATGFPEGTDFSNAVIPAKQDTSTFTIKLPDDMSRDEILSPVWTAEAVVWGGRTMKRPALYAEDQMQAFIYHHILPVDKGYVIPVNPAPFKISASADESPIKFNTWGNKTVTFNVEFTDDSVRKNLLASWEKRKENPKAKNVRAPFIKVELENPPEFMTMEPLSIPITTNKITAIIKIKKAKPIKDNMLFSASLKNGKDLEVTRSAAIPYEVIQKKWTKPAEKADVKTVKPSSAEALAKKEKQAKKNAKEK